MASTVGVISDTHGLMRESALKVLTGAALIIHAGDVGAPDVLTALSGIAPVYAIRGNIDREDWALALPATRTVEIEEARIFVLHNLADLAFDPAARRCRAVISGHSHRAHYQVRGGALYLNPGSAGPRRFRLPVTVALLTVEGATLSPRILTLDA